MLAHIHMLKERFAGWWTFGIDTTAPTSVGVECPPKNDKKKSYISYQKYVTYHTWGMLFSC